MGGCRCFFRDCKVNTYKNPLMHFFRFPMKDSERFKLWVKYSKLQNIINYPLSRQKNCVICSRHFRDECFMNYKKERLTPSAVPTIHRLAIDKALDYELDEENGVLVTLTEPTQGHLIPPIDFECPLGLDIDEALWVMLKNSEKSNSTGDRSNNEFGMSNNGFVIDELDDVVQHNRSVGEFIPIPISIEKAQHSQKRSRNEEKHNLVFSSNKRIKTLNCIQQIPATDTEHISIRERTTIALDNEDINPTIINHQIIEADGEMWVSQESYNIADNGAGYELVEIQPNDENNPLAVENEKSLSPSETTNEAPSASGDLCSSEQCQANCLEMENTNTELNEENKTLERRWAISQEENSRLEKCIETLKSEVETITTENDTLKKQIQDNQTSDEKEISLRKCYEQELQSEQSKNAQIEETLQQQILTLEQSLELVRQQLTDTKNNLSSAKKDYASVQREKMNLIKQQVEADHNFQNVQDMYDNLNIEHTILQKNYEILQKSHTKLKEDFTKLESQQNQVSTVTTSNNSLKEDASQAGVPKTQPTAPVVVGSLTKAQLFNGIKRYVSTSMMALLRMEMFGTSEREWKPDERQVAVDLLRLGETVYKYFTDEWRIRLPGLRDARNWLSQAVDVNDEEDL